MCSTYLPQRFIVLLLMRSLLSFSSRSIIIILVNRGPKLDPMHTSSLYFLSSPIQNSDKLDFRTAHINLVQDDTETIDKHKNWKIILFKEALKIKN